MCALVCRKDVMVNEIAGFDVLKTTNLVILSELTVECVLGFGKFVRIFKDPS